ncbi:MAG: type II toxin-antitoxin system VapC family toxin [Nitrososphaerales archaeon]|nr:type II toxin-antitoxin system VapC family toxin [Nitrososphaerales archaeon]
MTVLIDSWAWVEYWKGGARAKAAAAYIEGEEEAVASTINLSEVYFWILKYYGEGTAMGKVSTMEKRCHLIPVEKRIALEAAKVRRKHGLALADSLVYATAKEVGARVVTGDPDLRDLEGTIFLQG